MVGVLHCVPCMPVSLLSGRLSIEARGMHAIRQEHPATSLTMRAVCGFREQAQVDGSP